MDSVFSTPGDGQTIKNPAGGDTVFKARAEQTGGALTAFESAIGPGEGPPLHVHEDDNEVIYFLDGQFRMKMDDSIRNAPAGSFVFIPKGVPHAWQNIGDTPGRFLAMFMPAATGMEQFFERFEAGAGTFATLAEAAGMQVVGPPLSQSDPLT